MYVSEKYRGELKEDYIASLKYEYLKKGYSEKDSTNLAIQDYANCDFGDEIVKYLSSRNKYNVFSFNNLIKCLACNFTIYICSIFILVILDLVTPIIKFKPYETIIYILIGIFSFIYINLKTYSKKIAAFTILLSNIGFLILIKFFIPLIMYFINSNNAPTLLYSSPISYFIIITLISVIMTYFFNETFFKMQNL